MKNLVLLLSLVLLLALTPEVALSQDMAPKKLENPQWKSLVYVDYKPGKTDRAVEIIRNYFRKAAEKAGTPKPQMAIKMGTGKYDLVLVWNMEGGIEDMNWEISPNNVAWLKALNEIAGSAEKAKEIRDEYNSLISSASAEVGYVNW